MELLEECLLNRVPVNVADKTGNTPLHYASRTGQLACLNRLLNVVPPVNVNAQNRGESQSYSQSTYVHWRLHVRTMLVRTILVVRTNFFEGPKSPK